MEARFNVTKEDRKALVAAISELIGCASAYQGAPSFAFAVGGSIIDKTGTITFDGQMSAEDVRTLLTELTERGFAFEGDIDEIAPVAPAPEVGSDDSLPGEDGDGGEDSTRDTTDGEDSPGSVSLIETPGTLVIEVPLAGFTRTALDNLEKMVTSKAALILKAIGLPESDAGNDLPIEQTESTLRFPWFPLPASKDAIDAYSRFILALCEMAKKQKRVTMKDSDVESEKFAMRCFLLRLGFIGKEYGSARKILLSKLSGSGSFKSGNHKREASPESATTADSGGDNADRESGINADSEATGGGDAVPARCSECPHHCYYMTGLLRTKAGDIVDTSNRTPTNYTHYCLGAPSGFRKLKNGAEWSGTETPTKWCPLSAAKQDQSVEECHTVAPSGEDNAEAVNVREGDSIADNGATGGNEGALCDCLACANSLSEPAEKDGGIDRLFCVVKQDYVRDDGSCGEFNC